jgi:lipid II:glycine glycyltransferase (peptidoglycan interpeptide bridge formation enzyme)
MKTLQNISEIDSEQWAALIKKSPVASFFQTKECYDFYASLSFLKPFVFAVEEDDRLTGIVCGYIVADGGKIKRYFSRRAIVPGGVLLDENISEKALEKLLNTAVESLKKQAIYIEIRNYNNYASFRQKIEETGFQYQPHLDIHLRIDAETEDNISESKRREIRTAQKNGVQYAETENREEITQFYHILQHLYKKEVKLPLFPLAFFLKLSQLEQGKIFVIKQNGRIIGGSACVTLSDKTLYEWFSCGDRSVEKRFYPSVMSTFAGIDFAMKNGFSTYDFMGAGKPETAYGVRDFKAKFGGEIVEFGRFIYITKPFLYHLGKKAIQFIKNKK